MKLTARHLSGEVCHLEIDSGLFTKVTTTREDTLDLPWIAPGLIDIQVNGFAGVDYNRPLSSDEAWRDATQQLYAQGCTGFLIALITNTDEGYAARLTELTAQLARDPRNCLGFHMEGPWLNPDPGYRGAHRAEWMRPPDVATLEAWRAIAGPWLKLITLAPEIDPARAARVIRAGLAHDIRFFLGHSAAMGEVLAGALEVGAVGWTHLGNAAPAIVPKFDNVIFHALSQPGLVASLIPDGLHLPPHAFRALARALHQTGRLLLTTDAMAAAGAATSTGHFTLGEVEVEVAADGSARLPGSGRLAGSTLTPFEGVVRAERMSGLLLQDVWTAFSTRPADLLGSKHGIARGNSADFCLLSPESNPYLLATYHRGVCVFEAP
jgi:N-acetylglucosamine-6-phosphate deacetylase